MHVAVLGGGLQGACVAMELASAGITVDLYDKNDRCMTQASAQNEGKIHLGYVYANDRTLSTARAMVKGAIVFSSLLRRVPVELYRKRYHAENTHTKWATWPAEKRARAWTVHCADMLEQAMLVGATVQERRLLWLAAVGRLVSPRTAFGYLSAASLTSIERVSLLDAFFEQIRTVRAMDIPGWLEASWEETQQWTRGFYWLPSEARAT